MKLSPGIRAQIPCLLRRKLVCDWWGRQVSGPKGLCSSTAGSCPRDLNQLIQVLWKGAITISESVYDWIGNHTAPTKLLRLCLTLCDPIDSSLPGSPIPGILQARTLEQVAISFSNVWKWKVKIEIDVAQSCPTLSDPMDCSLPGSSIHGIFQARVLEWGAIAFSRNHTKISKTKVLNSSL